LNYKQQGDERFLRLTVGVGASKAALEVYRLAATFNTIVAGRIWYAKAEGHFNC
jgi:hypothetical protein